MATGYDIGVSSSTALSFSTPQTTDAGTVFNFSSPGASGDWYSQDQTANPEATAVATAKSPDSPISLGSGPDSGSGSAADGSVIGIGTLQLLIGAATLVAIVYFSRR